MEKNSQLTKSIITLGKLLSQILLELERLQKLKNRKPTPTEIKTIISATFKSINSNV